MADKAGAAPSVKRGRGRPSNADIAAKAAAAREAAGGENSTGETTEGEEGTARKRVPFGANVTDETIQDFCTRALGTEKDLESAKKTYQSANSNHRAVLKDAKKAGINPDRIRRFLELRKMEPEDVQREVAELNRILVCMSYPANYQLGLFENGVSVATEIENRRLAGDETDSQESSFEAGKAAGKAGKPLTSNPYETESENWNQFEEGWGAAQRDLIKSGVGRPN